MKKNYFFVMMLTVGMTSFGQNSLLDSPTTGALPSGGAISDIEIVENSERLAHRVVAAGRVARCLRKRNGTNETRWWGEVTGQANHATAGSERRKGNATGLDCRQAECGQVDVIIEIRHVPVVVR